MKDLQDLFVIEEPDKRFPSTFLRDIENPIGYMPLFRIEKADHFSKRLDGGETLIACFGDIFSLFLQFMEEGDNKLPGDVFQSKGFDLDSMILCRKGQEKSEGIAVGLDGLVAHPFDMGEIVIEELMDAGGYFHLFQSCQIVKS